MAVSNQQIIDFLLANPGMSDAEIAANMATYGVSPAQMAQATGTSVNEIIARAAATVPEGSSITLGDTNIAPQYKITGSGEDREVGGIENIYVMKTNGDINYRAPVGSTYTQLGADGSYERTGVVQKVDNGLKEIAGLAAAYFMPVIGAEIAASLGVSTATGTALAQAGFQAAQGADAGDILKGMILSQATGAISSSVASELQGLSSDPLTQKLVTNIGTTVVKDVVTGNTDNLGKSVLGSVVGTVVGEQTGSKAAGAAAATLATTGSAQAAAMSYAAATGVSQAKANDVVKQLENSGLVDTTAGSKLASMTGSSITADGAIDSLPESDLNAILNGGSTTLTFNPNQDEFGDLAGAQAAAAANTTKAKFGDVFAANKLAFPGQNFVFEDKTYTTQTAAEAKAAADAAAAKAAAANQSPAETARLLAQNSALVKANAANQSPAETARLAAQDKAEFLH